MTQYNNNPLENSMPYIHSGLVVVFAALCSVPRRQITVNVLMPCSISLHLPKYLRFHRRQKVWQVPAAHFANIHHFDVPLHTVQLG